MICSADPIEGDVSALLSARATVTWLVLMSCFRCEERSGQPYAHTCLHS